MIELVDKKRPDFAYVESLLARSATANRWTNFGPVAESLEEEVAGLLDLPAEQTVVSCSSGTMALHALVNLHGFLSGRPLRWLVSAFTFACQRQGPLTDARVVDCGTDGLLDIEAVRRVDTSLYDGVIVTNLFGGFADFEAWTTLAREKGKRLLWDSAACIGSPRDALSGTKWGDGEAFSFHHTKPCGFGEGGCIVVAKEHEGALRSILNFGRHGGIDTGPYSLNGKLSDVAAAFILDRLRQIEEIRLGHQDQWARISSLARRFGFEVLGAPDPGLPWVLALSGQRPAPPERLANPLVSLKKYYRPLDATAVVAEQLFERVICWPCHPGMAQLHDREIEHLLKELTD